MRLRRGLSPFWAFMHRRRLVPAHMPFWRVVVEARLLCVSDDWPPDADAAVVAIFVWARTIEEAEGLAALALEEEGMTAYTADAKKEAPASAPRRTPGAVARSEYGFLRYDDDEAPSRRGARA